MIISPLFTPKPCLLGGLVIGAASTLHLATNGRVTGYSGMLQGIFEKNAKCRDWRLAFLSGTVTSGIVLSNAVPEVFGAGITTNAGSALAAGALVGFGTQLGSGCTSGHGVCGLARRSARSLVATATFMATGFATQAAMVHNDAVCKMVHKATAWDQYLANVDTANLSPSLVFGGIAAGALGTALRGVSLKDNGESAASVLAGYSCGGLFGAGLGMAHMTDPQKVQSFLDIAGIWDPSLAFVMGGALAVNVVAWPLILRRKRPALLTAFSMPTKQDVTPSLVLGSGVFGIGWALAGVCPGPGLVGATTGDPRFLVWMAGLGGGVGLFKALARRGWFATR